MVTPDVISSETNSALRTAAAQYIETVHMPGYIRGVDGFATTHLGLDEPRDDLRSLVTGDEKSLAISVQGNDHERVLFVNVDLVVPDGGPVSIVEPGLYNEHGERDADGELARPIDRALTEKEGQELIMDLHSIMKEIA
jgi:hypothetical protein